MFDIYRLELAHMYALIFLEIVNVNNSKSEWTEASQDSSILCLQIHSLLAPEFLSLSRSVFLKILLYIHAKDVNS